MPLNYGNGTIKRVPQDQATELAPSIAHKYETVSGEPHQVEGGTVIRRRQPSEQPPAVTTKKRATK